MRPRCKRKLSCKDSTQSVPHSLFQVRLLPFIIIILVSYLTLHMVTAHSRVCIASALQAFSLFTHFGTEGGLGSLQHGSKCQSCHDDRCSALR